MASTAMEMSGKGVDVELSSLCRVKSAKKALFVVLVLSVVILDCSSFFSGSLRGIRGIREYVYAPSNDIIGEPIPLAGGALKLLDSYHMTPSLEERSVSRALGNNRTALWSKAGDGLLLLPQPVTAITRKYLPRLTAHLAKNFDVFLPPQKIIVYDIGTSEEKKLSKKQREQVLALGGGGRVELRTLVDALPPDTPRHVFEEHGGKGATYAWKMVIVALILQEFGAAVWLDTSIEFRSSILPALEKFVGPTGALKNTFGASDTLGSPFYKFPPTSKGCFFYCGIEAPHSTFCASSANMTNFIPPANMTVLSQRRQMGSGCFVVYNTVACKTMIMEPALACSLHYPCIGFRTEPVAGYKAIKKNCEGTLESQKRIFRRSQSLPAILVQNFIGPSEAFPRVTGVSVVSRTPKV